MGFLFAEEAGKIRRIPKKCVENSQLFRKNPLQNPLSGVIICAIVSKLVKRGARPSLSY